MDVYTLTITNSAGDEETHTLIEHCESAAIRTANERRQAFAKTHSTVGASWLKNEVTDVELERSSATDWEWAGID